MANFEILAEPLGSQFTSNIGANDSDDKNDFPIFIIADENVTLVESNITLSAVDGSNRDISDDIAIVEFEGQNSVHRAVIRPMQVAGMLTVSIAQNAVPEGNPQTSKSIRISTQFPDDDADVPVEVFNANLPNPGGIAITPTRILIFRGQTLHKFTFSGTEQTAERVTYSVPGIGAFTINNAPIDYLNGDILIGGTIFNLCGRFSAEADRQIQRYRHSLTNGVARRTVLFATRLGIINWFSTSNTFVALPWGTTDAEDSVDYNVPSVALAVAEDSDLLFVSPNQFRYELFEITPDDTLNFIRNLNIDRIQTINGNPVAIRDSAIYQGTLYILYSSGHVYTLDIHKYRPLSKNTKSSIYPVFASNGDTVDLTQFSPDAERIVFDVGTDKQPYLSINSESQLAIASNAVSETTPVLVKLRAINRIDSQPFSFYLIIEPARRSVWRDTERLVLFEGMRFNLFDIVSGAERILASTLPAGSTVVNGVLTAGSESGTAVFVAIDRHGNRQAKTLYLESVRRERPTTAEGYRVEIAGRDVSHDLRGHPVVQEQTDATTLNEYRVNEVSLRLKSNRSNGFRYNMSVSGNFFETHGLVPSGFRERVDVYIVTNSAGLEEKHLLFSGVILRPVEQLSDSHVDIVVVDETSLLREQRLVGVGALEKWDILHQQTDEGIYETIYVPEVSLRSMQLDTADVWHSDEPLQRNDLQNSPSGPRDRGNFFQTAEDIRVDGVPLEAPPIVRFKPNLRSEDVQYLMNQIALNGEVVAIDIDLAPPVDLDTPTRLNRGSVPFSVEPTRTTRLPRDWVVGVESGLQTPPTVLILLSNPEGHIRDLLVQYDVEGDAYRVLHTFDSDVKVHRIERRNATNSYMLTSAKIAQDRSARQFPRPDDRTGYGYDSAAVGSKIQIYHYDAGTGALTEVVTENDSYPPQLGIHYWVGFENALYINEFEGIRPDDRGTFKWHNGNLYYRYAKDGEFGVARVNTGGTTTQMIGQTELSYQNHLNFAFDINSSGTVYFVYATSDAETSTLTLKRRTRNGVETTLFSETRGIGYFNELGFEFGAFLGAHEALFHNNSLYILAPIQKADLGDSTRSVVNPDVHIQQRTAEQTGVRTVTTHTNVNPSNQILAPGEDIPLRIIFDGFITGATQNDLTVYGGSIVSFSITSNFIDVTIRPESETRHKNIVIDVAEDAVDQGNEGWRIVVDFGTQRSQTKSAGMALYRVNTTAQNPTLEVIKTWDFVQLAGCNLTIHEAAVHFIAQAAAPATFKPINPDLDGYWTDDSQTQTMGYNAVPEVLGGLTRIERDGSLTDLGNLWFQERPYNKALTRCLSFDSGLHVVMGYGESDAVLRYNSLASAADNFQHIVYTPKLAYIVPSYAPTLDRYTALADLAKKTNATLSMRNGILSVKSRSNRGAPIPVSGRDLRGRHPVIQHDTQRIFNIIRDTENRFERRDAESIRRFKELVLPLNLGLTPNEKAWQIMIFKEYLEELKDLQRLLRFTLRPSFHLHLGDVIEMPVGLETETLQIISIAYHDDRTVIRGRTV